MSVPRWLVKLPVNGDQPSEGDAVECSTDLAVAAQILRPPDGLGNPGLTTEDVSYPQRDGETHYADWYEPRILTWAEVLVRTDPSCGVNASLGAFEAVQLVKRAWRRRQEDIEAWLTINGQGPFAVVGRPRVAEVDWLTGYYDSALFTLRFDANDRRLFLLEVDEGTGEVVGDGWQQTSVIASAVTPGRTYDRVYGVVRDHSPQVEMAYGGSGDLFVNINNQGTVSVPAMVTFRGLLHQPSLQNITTGEELRLVVDVAAGTPGNVVVDTDDGKVTQGGANRFGWVVGNPRDFLLAPGMNTLRLVDDDPGSATGEVVVRWRPAVT